MMHELVITVSLQTNRSKHYRKILEDAGIITPYINTRYLHLICNDNSIQLIPTNNHRCSVGGTVVLKATAKQFRDMCLIAFITPKLTIDFLLALAPKTKYNEYTIKWHARDKYDLFLQAKNS